jgi:ferritin-like metal-binding protein YciE
MSLGSLHDLYVDELKDLFNAENQLLKALPKMAKAASAEGLKAAFEEHLEVTRGQVGRLEKIFKGLGVNPKGKKCKAMEGLVEEGKEVMEENGAAAVIDAALIAAAQRVEHYEMAGYGCVRTFAKLLAYEDAAALLRKRSTRRRRRTRSSPNWPRRSSTSRPRGRTGRTKSPGSPRRGRRRSVDNHRSAALRGRGLPRALFPLTAGPHASSLTTWTRAWM